MNRKQFGILLVLLIVLGGAGWYLQNSRNHDAGAGEQGTGQKLMGDSFPLNDVAQISVKHGPDELRLMKRDDLWRVRERNDYPANFSKISEFLLKIRDLKVIQNEPVGPSQFPRMQFTTNGDRMTSGIVIDLNDKDAKSIRSLVLGKKLITKKINAPVSSDFDISVLNGDGRYILMASNPGHALLIADPMNDIEPKAEDWLSKDFFKIERPKAIAVAFPNVTNSWKIVRDVESGDWKFADPQGDEKLDAARASGVSSPFSSPSFNDVHPLGTKADEYGMDKATTITVDTFDDFTYVIKAGAKEADDVPIAMTVSANFPKERIPAKDEKPEDKSKADKAWQERQKQLEAQLKQTKRYESWIFMVPSFVVDPILKQRKDLDVEKKDETKPADKPAVVPAPETSSPNTVTPSNK